MHAPDKAGFLKSMSACQKVVVNAELEPDFVS